MTVTVPSSPLFAAGAAGAVCARAAPLARQRTNAATGAAMKVVPLPDGGMDVVQYELGFRTAIDSGVGTANPPPEPSGQVHRVLIVDGMTTNVLDELGDPVSDSWFDAGTRPAALRVEGSAFGRGAATSIYKITQLLPPEGDDYQ